MTVVLPLVVRVVPPMTVEELPMAVALPPEIIVALEPAGPSVPAPPSRYVCTGDGREANHAGVEPALSWDATRFSALSELVR